MKTKQTIQVEQSELARIIQNYQGPHIFGVEFIKKDGSIRKMAARKHVQKNLKGTGLKYNPNNYGLMCVFDINTDEYRMVNLNTLRKVNVDGFRYELR